MRDSLVVQGPSIQFEECYLDSCLDISLIFPYYTEDFALQNAHQYRCSMDRCVFARRHSSVEEAVYEYGGGEQ